MTRTLETYANQDAAKKDLTTYVGNGRVTALGQALNQAYNGQGKNSGNHVVDGEQRQVFHASAGKAGTNSSVTLFYYPKDPSGSFHLVALGEHASADLYKIDKELGQDQAPFQKKKTVGPEGK
ncbi:hypothetical protein [Streptomyces lunalinharesii]|uniref:Uncharacterized protein n=1 Tax=Streptomyces lunalinharesii TaxID=333384 RepID=A0ABN3RKB8_9ACTN